MIILRSNLLLHMLKIKLSFLYISKINLHILLNLMIIYLDKMILTVSYTIVIAHKTCLKLSHDLHNGCFILMAVFEL